MRIFLENLLRCSGRTGGGNGFSVPAIEGDAGHFSKVLLQLLEERHPGQGLRHIEGGSGDQGLDVFAGELSGKPVIWQCKSFPNGVGKSQKEQIRKSLRTALKHFSPSYWILCPSVDLDTKASRWFEKLKKSYESKVRIGEMLASNIVNELLHRRTLRNHFFPNASLDVIELKRLAARTGDMSAEELGRVTDANLEDIIERWKERDARFSYQIVFDGDLGPPASRQEPLQPGLVMSVREGGKTINVFARDVVSLRANPPQFHTTFKGTGVQKYHTFLRTGVAQEFEADELESFGTDLTFMSAAVEIAKPYKLIVSPLPALTDRRRSVRVEFVGKSGAEIVRYEMMEFRPVRAGTEEWEFSLSGNNVPFKVSVVVSVPGRSAAVTFHLDATQRDPKLIKKFLDALNLLRPSGKIHVLDLETEKPLLDSISSLPDETPQQAGRRALINDVVAISDRFKADLKMPDKLTEEDLKTISLLKEYMGSGTIELNDISFVLTKSKENRDLVPQRFAVGKIFVRFTNIRHEPLPILLGVPVDTGPVTIETEAEINDLSTTLRTFEKTAIGSGVRISVRPLAPVRVSLSSGETEHIA